MNASLKNLADHIRELSKKYHDNKSFAVFDFDNTIIRNDIQEALFAYMCEKGVLRNPSLSQISLLKNPKEFHKNVFERYHCLAKAKKYKEAYKYAVRVLAGFTKSEVEKLTRLTIQKEGDKMKNRLLFGLKVKKGIVLRKNIRDLMSEVKKIGIEVWVVTASSEIVVKTALKHFRINARCIGMRLVEKGGVLEDEFILPLSSREGKVACIKKYIHHSIRPLVAAGDSMNDFFMLKYARLGIVIRKDKKLIREAQRKGWSIVK